MEVHQHTHTPRKKWTHYFWEFLMLFLAITAGFFVENMREHYVEHNRAKQYASFLYADLVKDTANLKSRTEFMEMGNNKLDTLVNILKSFEKGSAADKIYSLSIYAYSNPFYGATTSTMDQLKSSGSLRYFQNNELTRNFSKYDTDLQNLKTVEARNVYIVEETRMFLAQFLDLKGTAGLVLTDSSGILVEPVVSTQLKLYKEEPGQLEQYANLCVLKQLDWTNRIRLQHQTLKSARNLILSLKKEYRLE